ncbi:quinon protein alcohol dehydrogenase-like superfamily [Suillus paluster]|uniref:quinon protein alcohol dehydrogenase-like superfamily n=1 Tax=Suillus paluster TaxID=48578 RepID=UPI001B87A010|nr:quinon protein alcohol dehydrogenase-like superfamily [Suillus paluster]KAG1722175.1 quinon protein alcohol dehydrogenase-like superfamily [Suillus paluster]
MPSATPIRTFKDDEGSVLAVAGFSDKRRMVTLSDDGMLRLWDLRKGVVLNKTEGHRRSSVYALAVSRDGQVMASSGSGQLMTWDGNTGEPLNPPTRVESHLQSLDFSPDGTVLAAGCWDDPTIREWDSSTWKQRVRLWQVADQRTIAIFRHSDEVHCVTFSADDRHIFSGGTDNQISEWPASEPEDALPQDGLTLKELATL